MSERPAVELRGLSRAFPTAAGPVEALRGVELVIRPGEFVAVMGPSGSGKSTLLHLIAGLDRPTAGEVRVGGESLADLDDDDVTLLRRRRLGIVFQAFNLIDVLTAEENVALPLLIDGVAEAGGHRALERGVAAAVHHEVGVAADQAGGVDAERHLLAPAGAQAVDVLGGFAIGPAALHDGRPH